MTTAKQITDFANEVRAANDEADATSLQRFADDAHTLILRRGKSRVISAFLDAWRLADAEGAEW